MQLIQSIRQEISAHMRSEKFFVFFVMLVGFCIAGEYAITRPASTSIFLSVYSTKHLPFVWLVTVPLNFLVVYLYNRFLPKIGPMKMLGSLAAIVAVIHISCAFWLSIFPPLIFLQFVWKDIYILLMFKQLWSLIHTTIKKERAKYLYGMIYGMGTLGSVICSLIPGFLAVDFGSYRLFLLTLPLYAVLFWAYRNAFARSSLASKSFIDKLETKDPSPKESLSMIRRSPFLVSLLFLVVFMQVSVGLMEYQFNSYLELNIVDQDIRTAYCGRITAVVNLLSGLFQCIGSFFLVHTLGLRGSHLFIPCVLFSNLLLFIWFPSFIMISLAFVFLKAIDFSLFGVVREMLYIPLKMDEKFRAKAIIDVFAYRTSKAVASCFILILQIVASAYLLPVISYVSLAIFVGWFILVTKLFKKYQNVSLAEIKQN
ncbi:MAG TPA: hypothetical protein DCE71_00915 [Parachlamydiales bacterium]|nr:hypothetical protein [Parachlamydiales bacterium]